MTNLAQPAAEIVTCQACSARNSEGTGFCQQCGERLFDKSQPAPRVNPHLGTTPAAPGVKQPRLGNLAAEHHGKEIRSARIAIMLVSVLTVISAAAYWMMLDAELAKIRSDPAMFVVQSAVNEARLLIIATFAIGMLFLGLFFWAKRNPFGATLTALIVYLTSMVANAAVDPQTMAKGWLIKGIVIVVLANCASTAKSSACQRGRIPCRWASRRR